MPPIPTRIPSPCRALNSSTAFLLPLNEYLPIDPLETQRPSCYGDQHASVLLKRLAPNHRLGDPDECSGLTEGFVLDLQHVALARHHLVEHRAHDTAKEEARHESRYNDDGERFL
jgi:hypothetical protein